MTAAPPGVETEFARLLDDLADRRRRGASPNLDDYAAEHPHLAETIRQLATVLDLLPSNRDAVPELTGFRIVKELGRGGMGVVYEAVDDALGRRVALKALPPQAAARPQWLDRFRREAKAAARLHHTNIVPVFGVGEQNGIHYFAMQAIDGVSLEKPTDASVSQIATWGAKLAEALAHAHSLGVLHRDIKPSNILIDRTGEPYLTDFGLAKLTDDGDLTGTGDFLGTLRYAAPEQMNNQFDERSDLYSLGATLYELLAKKPPFVAEDRGALVRQIAESEPTPLREIPRDLATIVYKAMAKEQANRYATAAAMAEDLRRFLAGEAVAARPVTAFERTARWAKRHPAIAGLSAAVAALLLAVAATAVVGYVHTSQALDRAEHSEVDARKSLDQTLASIREAHAIVDAMPDGYLNFIFSPACSGADALDAYRSASPAEMVERMIDLYEAFLREPLSDPAARREQVKSWRRLAFLYQESERDRTAEAERAYHGAIAAANELAVLEPHSTLGATEAALARGFLGNFLLFMRQLDPGHYLTGLSQAKAILADHPHDAVLASDIGDLIRRHSMTHDTAVARNADVAESLTFHKRALSISRAPFIRRRLVDTFEFQAYLLKAARNASELERILDDWAACQPRDAVVRLRLATLAADGLDLVSGSDDRNAQIARWKTLVERHLQEYHRLGGLATDSLRLLSVRQHFRDDPHFQKLFASIPTSPTAFTGPANFLSKPERSK